MIFLPSGSWEIKTTAKKGRGLFAKQNILAGTIIGDYLGVMLNPLTADLKEKDQGLYLMYYHDKALIYPSDISSPGVHLINHSCMPNSSLYTYYGHTLFFTLRHIYPGEEITISYQLAPNSNCKTCTHQCFCNTLYCTGSMHLTNERFKKWNAFSDLQSKQTRRAAIRYGKVLPLLKQYPVHILDNPVYSLYGSLQETEFILPDKKTPPLFEIRKIIRQTGKTVSVPFLNLKIYGIQDNAVISQKV